MNKSLKERAEAVMPAGVNSPVRAFKSVGGDPIFAASGNGCLIRTVDGRKLIDFCLSFGPLILGHAHAEVIDAISETAKKGTSFAVTTVAEIELAELIREAIPSMERLRLVNSGTEACMTALRLARGATGRNKILKFSGCYHGHADGLLVQAGSGVAGIATASSAGVSEALARNTLVAPYNDFEHVTELVRKYGDEIAVIVVEPVAGNMGLIPPVEGFLKHLRAQADACGALLLFDEVINGFRFTFGGYQNLCGIKPDLTCLGKIIGGGMPIGAVGGRKDLMEHIAPLGPVYQAGTLSGNPVSVAAGLATLKVLKRDNPYEELEERCKGFVKKLAGLFAENGITVQIPQMGSLFSFFFTGDPVNGFEDVQKCDADIFKKMFHALLSRNIYLPPSPFETCFISTVHSRSVLDQALDDFRKALKEL